MVTLRTVFSSNSVCFRMQAFVSWKALEQAAVVQALAKVEQQWGKARSRTAEYASVQYNDVAKYGIAS